MAYLKPNTELKSRYRGKKINGKCIDEHRYVASLMLGRPLRHDEVVHHKDGNKLNNDPGNLAIMSSTEHRRLHGKLNTHITKMSKEDRITLSKHIWEAGKCDGLKFEVIAFDKKTGVEVARYDSTREAARHGHASSHVADCCNGKAKSYHDLVWRYAKDIIP